MKVSVLQETLVVIPVGVEHKRNVEAVVDQSRHEMNQEVGQKQAVLHENNCLDEFQGLQEQNGCCDQESEIQRGKLDHCQC